MDDAAAKKIIESWPDPLVPGTEWRRLRTAGKDCPYLYIPGSREFSVYPDGLYGHFVCDENNYIEYADVLAIEVCQSRQNYCNKRSRYAEQNPLGMYCKPEWLKSAEFLAHIADHDLQNIPVRYRAILYVLPPKDFAAVKRHISPWGNEYFVSDDLFPLAFSSFANIARPDARFLEA